MADVLLTPVEFYFLINNESLHHPLSSDTGTVFNSCSERLRLPGDPSSSNPSRKRSAGVQQIRFVWEFSWEGAGKSQRLVSKTPSAHNLWPPYGRSAKLTKLTKHSELKTQLNKNTENMPDVQKLTEL